MRTVHLPPLLLAALVASGGAVAALAAPAGQADPPSAPPAAQADPPSAAPEKGAQAPAPPPTGGPAAAGASPQELALRRTELEAEVASQPYDPALRILLGDLLARLGEIDAAVASFTRATELATVPEDVTASHLAIAILERDRGHAEASLQHYQLAFRSEPSEPMVLYGLATLLAQLGRHREAVPYFGLLIAAQPRNLRVRIAGVTALILAGEHARAKIALEQALAAFPESLDLLDILARHLAACPDRTVRDGPRAVELATRLVEKVPTAESHETLAMAHAQAGGFDRAAAEQRELIARFAAEVDAPTADRWRAHLKLYEAGQPCCAGE
jgi:tetratricopeptide (TPR) repeat protein